MIRKIIDYCGKNRLIVLILTGFLVVTSIYAIRNIPLDAIPDLSDTQVIVFTEWKGRSPQLIEDQITYPLVSKLLSAPKVKVIRGQSFFGFSFIYVIFEDGTDIYWARSRVLEYLNTIQKELPNDVTPIIGPDATGVGWVYQYALVDKENQYDLAYLRTLNDWYLKYWLSAVPGVAEVASVGGFVKQYQIEVDPNKLRAFNIPLKTLITKVKENNQDSGARSIEIAGHEYLINIAGYIKSIDDIKKISLGIKPNGVPVRVSDVAKVRLGPDMRRGATDFNGLGETVSGIIVMRYGENALKTIDKVKEKIEEIKPSLPEGIEIVPVYDRSELIHNSINTLTTTLIIESIIVVLITLLFLFHFPSALVIILTLPVAILISFIAMKLMGINSNIMSLGGIAIAMGTMVDASIVMVENTHKHLEKWNSETDPEKLKNKPSKVEIILTACKEMGPPIFLSLLIIAVSFLPIFTLEAEEGRLFKPLAYTKTFAMFFAAFVAITLTPALITLFMPSKVQPEFANPVSRFLRSVYEPIIKYVLKRPVQTIIVASIALLGSLPLVFKIGSEFMPPLNEGTILYMPTSLPGIGITEATRLAQIQDKLIMTIPEVDNVFAKVGRADTPTDPAPLDMFETVINLKPKKEWRPGMTWEKLIDELDRVVKIPGTTNAWTMPIKARTDMLSTGIRTPLGIKLFGPDLKTIEKIGQEIEQHLNLVKGTRSVYAERVSSGYYLNIDLDRYKIARHGLSIRDVEIVLESALGGDTITTTVEGQERYSIIARYKREFRDSPNKVKNIFVSSPMGHQIPLSELATISLDKGPMSIRDENASLASYVYIDISGIDIGSYVKEAKKVLAENLDLPTGYGLEWTGQYEFLQRIQKKLSVIVPATIFLIFVLAFLIFNSVSKALIVILSVPFALIGGLWLLFFNKFNFSVAVGVGFIALAGLAMETAIIMVLFLDEAFNKIKESGTPFTLDNLKQAVHDGAVLRLRPILMTASTDVLALFPIFILTGTGSDVMRRIAAPMVGGIFSATILTLVLIPVIYFLWRKWQLKLKAQVVEERV